MDLSLFENKKKYGSLYQIRFRDNEFAFFRLLKWDEFKSIRDTLMSLPHLEDDAITYIFKECIILYRDNNLLYTIDQKDTEFESLHEVIPAGSIDTIGRIIYRWSGASSSDEMFSDLNEMRDMTAYNIEERLIHVIAATFKIDPYELNDRSWEDILKLLAQSELIINGEIPEPPFRPAEEKQENIDFDKENQHSTA